jgi:hypothetical protein
VATRGVETRYAETYEPWAVLRVEPQRFVDEGERTAVVLGLHARVAGGQVDVESEIAHVVTIRHRRIVRLDGYEEPEALAVIGVEAQAMSQESTTPDLVELWQQGIEAFVRRDFDTGLERREV